MNSDVETTVDTRDESLPNSAIGSYAEDTTIISKKGAKCQWNGVDFADGDAVCADDVVYECHGGQWIKRLDGC